MGGANVADGSFFLWSADAPWPGSVPEEFSDEQRMIAALTAEFVRNEILPVSNDIDAMKPGLMTDLLRKAGELGLLAPDVPERWGGMGLDLCTSLLITENVGAAASFAVTHSDHTALGILPIVLFGNDDQKARYLPALATGEKIAAYALTEGSSGSDARAARTRAALSPDGSHYVLNGTKQFITNAGIADVFVVYAKVDGDKLTAFLVDRDSVGLSLGAEERKLGISGSSTRSVVFEDAKVPVENVLLEVGKGHVVAFNALNIGRLKLAAQCVGAAKEALQRAARYALERAQFGQPIARFGMIQDKLARMAALIYVAESMVYRSAARLGDAMATNEGASAIAATVAQHAMECSMNKVFASEALDFVADETIQVFGGYGYSQEYPAERIYRDARINRIFAGTNEINRLRVAHALLAAVQEGRPPAAGNDALVPQRADGPTARFWDELAAAKAAVLMVARMAIGRFGEAVQDQQEILALIADAAIDVYAMESGLLRAARVAEERADEDGGPCLAMLRSFANDFVLRVRGRCIEVLLAVTDAEALVGRVRELDNLLDRLPENGIEFRRRVAAGVLDAGGYPLG